MGVKSDAVKYKFGVAVVLVVIEVALSVYIALTILVVRREEHPACKCLENLVLSGVTLEILADYTKNQ